MTCRRTPNDPCKIVDFSTLTVYGRNRELIEDAYGAIVIPLIAMPYDRRPTYGPVCRFPRKHPSKLDDWKEN